MNCALIQKQLERYKQLECFSSLDALFVKHYVRRWRKLFADEDFNKTVGLGVIPKIDAVPFREDGTPADWNPFNRALALIMLDTKLRHPPETATLILGASYAEQDREDYHPYRDSLLKTCGSVHYARRPEAIKRYQPFADIVLGDFLVLPIRAFEEASEKEDEARMLDPRLLPLDAFSVGSLLYANDSLAGSVIDLKGRPLWHQHKITCPGSTWTDVRKRRELATNSSNYFQEWEVTQFSKKHVDQKATFVLDDHGSRATMVTSRLENPFFVRKFSLWGILP